MAQNQILTINHKTENPFFNEWLNDLETVLATRREQQTDFIFTSYFM